MEQKKYTILWLDDQHDKMDLFKLQAKQNGIELDPFKSLEGMAKLERDFTMYDGVLFDAKFFEEENDERGSEDIKALDKAKERLLKLPKRFTPFVLTGQAKLYNDETFNSFFPNHYRKGNDNDIAELFADLKREAENQVDTQIRHDYRDIFEIFEAGYLSNEIAGQVLDLIKSPLPGTRFSLKGILTNVRGIHESCLIALEQINVIPNSQAKLSDILKHLSGNRSRESNYLPITKEYQNDSIENLHKWVHYTCSKYLHNLKDETYNGYMISRYAIDSLRNGILELLLWFKQVYKENK